MKTLLVLSLLVSTSILAGCAMPQSAGTSSNATQANGVATTAEPAGNYRTLYVPPPVGSLLGGGYVRVAQQIEGNDEAALLSTISAINAAAGSKQERPYVIAAMARTTGISEREWQAQQDAMQLRFGELLALNTIARSRGVNPHQIAILKAQGKSWTELANANGMSIAAVVQTARNVNDLTVSSFTNSAERSKGGPKRYRDLGVRTQAPPDG